MKRVSAITSTILVLATFTVRAGLLDLLPGTDSSEMGRFKSPDGRSVAILLHKARHGPALPPEPPKTLERWAELKIEHDGKTVFDSGYQALNIHQLSGQFAVDVVWSPDSRRVAYRHITSLRVIGLDGKSSPYTIGPEGSVISSFRWIDSENLLGV